MGTAFKHVAREERAALPLGLDEIAYALDTMPVPAPKKTLDNVSNAVHATYCI